MKNPLDQYSLELATRYAIESSNLELLRAVLALGVDPSRRYYTSILGSVTPFDHALRSGWQDGVALMRGFN